MTFKTVDDRFAVTGQIRPEEIEAIAAQGFTAILCARPDGEEPGQPSFAAVADAARRHGLRAFHVPVSGTPTPEEIARFGQAMADCDGPVLGYCRSGARAAGLYAALGR